MLVDIFKECSNNGDYSIRILPINDLYGLLRIPYTCKSQTRFNVKGYVKNENSYAQLQIRVGDTVLYYIVLSVTDEFQEISLEFNAENDFLIVFRNYDENNKSTYVDNLELNYLY